MNFIAICLHSLDMRDFHSHMRNTPFLDQMREKSIFIPMGRGQGHHRHDSLNAEMTGIWTARFSDARLTENGYSYCKDKSGTFPKTVIENLQETGYDIYTCIGVDMENKLGSFAVSNNSNCTMRNFWMSDQPDRLAQFNCPNKMNMGEWLTRIRESNKFYAHIFLRGTHRPWLNGDELIALDGKRGSILEKMARKISGKQNKHTAQERIAAARRLALEEPSELAYLRRCGLERTDQDLAQIFEVTKHIKDVTYIIYSNHGEVFDHFRHHLSHPVAHRKKTNLDFIVGTSHGTFPYEVLYANMQMWIIPETAPKVMAGVGRSIDFTPTILSLAGVTHESLDGESMLPHFASGVFPERDRYAEVPLRTGCISMVRKDGYKFISVEPCKTSIQEHSLAVFDLKTDPYEYVNLINTPQGQEVLNWAIKKHRSLREQAPSSV